MCPLVMDSQHFSNFQSLEDPSSLDVFLREAAAACGAWMVPVSLTPRACPATPHGRHIIHPRVHPGLAPQVPWGEGPRSLYLEGEEGVKSHRFSLKDGKKSGGINLDPHKKGSAGSL